MYNIKDYHDTKQNRRRYLGETENMCDNAASERHQNNALKTVIIKKKYYFRVTDSDEIKVVVMKGKKNDRPALINNVFDQFLEDLKSDTDPTGNLQAAINDLEQRRIDRELLEVGIKLSKDPADYAVNNPNKKIGTLLGARARDIIWYFKTGDKKKAIRHVHLRNAFYDITYPSPNLRFLFLEFV